MTTPSPDTPPKVAIRNLYKVFGPDPKSVMPLVMDGIGKDALLKDHRHVLGLREINVDIREGEITVIMGLSGSGKSTLIRHLNRLIEPTVGQVFLDNLDVMSLAQEDLRALRQLKMTMVFQKFALLPHRTVLENAATSPLVRGVPRDEAFAGARKWLERVGLGGNAEQYPHQLSGGMQQRVGIARALCSESEVMLMDEAFSALDPIIRTDMQALLLELQSELRKTIVFITHDLDEALRLADHLVVLKDGYVVQQGEPQQIILHPQDAYIENFIRDINRARVLRVRSIMQTDVSGPPPDEEVDANDSLEAVIKKAGGDANAGYRVVSEGAEVGRVNVAHILHALAG